MSLFSSTLPLHVCSIHVYIFIHFLLIPICGHCSWHCSCPAQLWVLCSGNNCAVVPTCISQILPLIFVYVQCTMYVQLMYMYMYIYSMGCTSSSWNPPTHFNVFMYTVLSHTSSFLSPSHSSPTVCIIPVDIEDLLS